MANALVHVRSQSSLTRFMQIIRRAVDLLSLRRRPRRSILGGRGADSDEDSHSATQLTLCKLPVELIHQIAGFLDMKGLIALIQTCRSMWIIAGDRLYGKIMMLDYQAHFFVRALFRTLFVQPDRARLVRSFSGTLFPLASDMDRRRSHPGKGVRPERDGADVELTPDMACVVFGNLVNLRSLSIYESDLGMFAESTSHPSRRIFDLLCPLQLTHFALTRRPFFPPGGNDWCLAILLRTQPLLEVLVLAADSGMLIPSASLVLDARFYLPKLRSFKGHSRDAIQIVPGRHVTTLSLLDRQPTAAPDDPWAVFASPATPILSLSFRLCDRPDVKDYLRYASLHLPDVEHLTLVDVRLANVQTVSPPPALCLLFPTINTVQIYAAVPLFTRLRSLEMHTPEQILEPEWLCDTTLETLRRRLDSVMLIVRQSISTHHRSEPA